MNGQSVSQRIKGYIVDSETKSKIPNVDVKITKDQMPKGSDRTDASGYFEINVREIGWYHISFYVSGYNEDETKFIEVEGNKETDLGWIELEEAIVKKTKSTSNKVATRTNKYGHPNNELACVSSKAFSVEEAKRYPGSRGDIARMVANFAGVVGANDTRNDLIIRGNSPFSLLWRMEGVNIPNPNHFAAPGTKGGAANIINNKYLADSDFITGSFPAEYGNSVGGVFDLKMRNGNMNQQEVSIEIGVLGAEVTLETPLLENKASLLVAGRVSLFDRLPNSSISNIKIFDKELYKYFAEFTPKYSDGAFRLHIPIENIDENKSSSIAFWGIGGQNNIDIKISERLSVPKEPGRYGFNDRNQNLNNSMYAIGGTYEISLDKNTFFKTTLAHSRTNSNAKHDYVFGRNIDSLGNYIDNIAELERVTDYNFNENVLSAYMMLTHKISNKTTLYNGFNIDKYYLTYRDETKAINGATAPSELGEFQYRWNVTKETPKRAPVLFQPHFQIKHKITNELKLTGGITNISFNINDTRTPWEPRLGASYKLGTHQFNLGIGWHSQLLPNYLYYFAPNDSATHTNQDIGIMTSRHIVLGYDKYFDDNAKIRIELFHQKLDDIPGKINSSTFSMVNKGSEYFRIFEDSLVNKGIGRNYGIDFTFEKFFDGTNYLLITGSLFDAKYQNINSNWFNSTFNTNYILNILGGWEFTKNNNILNIGGKITLTNGRRYGDIDYAVSHQALEVIYLDNANFNTQHFSTQISPNINLPNFIGYARIDFRFSYERNTEHFSHQISLDAANVLGFKNELSHFYHPDLGKNNLNNSVAVGFQFDFIPIIFYKINFALKSEFK